MNSVFVVLLFQVILGGFDNLWHHEFTEKLPSKPSARHELTMHSIRELIYGVIFVGLAWFEWHGGWVLVLSGLLIIELVVTLIDFIIEDSTRVLPPLERVLHTLLAINIGVFFAVLYPVLAGWMAQPNGMISVSYGIWSWLFTLFGAGVFIWGIRDAIAVMNLHIMKIPLWQRNPVRAGVKDNPKMFLITGATGFIGTKLVRELIRRGDNIIVLTRDIAMARHKFGPLVRVIDDLDEISDNEKIDTIINLAGEALAGGFWTDKRKQSFYDSRLKITRSLSSLVKRLNFNPEMLINASAIGFYGDRGDEELEERSTPKTDFMSDLCQKWEIEARNIETLGVNVVRLRIGLVLGKSGGLLAPIVLSTLLGGAMILGSGKQWMSWISLSDLIRMILFIDESKLKSSAINATAPHPERQIDFIKMLAKQLERPVWLRAPAFMLRFLLRDMADIFLCGQKVLPHKAMLLGFKFEQERLADALEEIYANKRQTQMDKGLRTYFNAECPVCEGEIAHYKKLEADQEIDFVDINLAPDALQLYGLNAEDCKRRLYVMDRCGNLYGGVDAFIAIWSQYSRYRLIAKALKLPIFHGFGAFVYDGLCVPFLARYNKRRAQSETKLNGRAHEN